MSDAWTPLTPAETKAIMDAARDKPQEYFDAIDREMDAAIKRVRRAEMARMVKEWEAVRARWDR